MTKFTQSNAKQTLESQSGKPTMTSAASKALLAIIVILTIAGAVLAVTRPPWLIGPIEATIKGAGPFGPFVFMLLCAVAAPLRLNEPLLLLSTLFWPWPLAILYSSLGSLFGAAAVYYALLRFASGLQRQDNWPKRLKDLSVSAAKRPYFSGVLARLALGSGLPLEAFFIVNRYSRPQFWLIAMLGVPLWCAQMIIGVTAIKTLVSHTSPWVIAAIVGVVVSIVATRALIMLRRRAANA